MKRILITLFTLTLLACGGAEERTAAYIEKATQSYEAGDYDKARIEIKNAIQIDPKHAPSHFLLGNIHEQLKDFSSAFARYSKAVELEPLNSEYQAKLGTYYLLSGDFDKAREIIATISENDPASLDNDILKVTLYTRENNIGDAVRLAESMVTNNPEEFRPTLILAQLYLHQKKYNDALNLFKKASKLDEANLTAVKQMAKIYLITDQPDNAVAVYKNIIKQDPDNYDHYKELAYIYKLENDDARAVNVLREAIALDEEDISRKLTLLSYIYDSRGLDAATEELKTMVSKSDEDNVNKLRLALAKLYHDTENYENEIAVYNDIIDSGDTSAVAMNARINLAKAYLVQNEIAQAEKIIDEALDVAPNDADALLLRSTIALINNDLERAIIDLRLVIKDKPEEIRAYDLLISAYTKNNNPDQAKDLLNKAYDNNVDDIEALLKVADLNVKYKNIAGAENAVDAVIRSDEDNIEALKLKTKILNTKKDYQNAMQIGYGMISAHPEDPEAYLLIVPSMLESGKSEELYTLINEGYIKTAHDLRLLEIMVAINSGNKNYDEAHKLITSALDEVGDNANLYRMLGKISDSSGNYEDSVKYYSKALSLLKDSASIYKELANIHVRAGDFASAIDVLKEGKANIPDDASIRISLASLYERYEQPNNAIYEYESLLPDYEDNTIINNNLAALLADHRTDAKSLALAKKLVENIKAVKQPAIMDTVGWVYYKTGDYLQSVSVLEEVVKQAPDIAIFNYHLGMAYSGAGNNESAKKHLKMAVDSGKQFAGIDEARNKLSEIN